MSTTPPPYGPSITAAEAALIMQAAEKDAASKGWPMVIAIVDAAGHLLMLHRMDNAQLASIEVARMKAETSLRFRRPTKVFEDLIGAAPNGARYLSLPGVLALEGGLPILRDGKVVGAVGVSGMASPQDAEVARAGIAALA